MAKHVLDTYTPETAPKWKGAEHPKEFQQSGKTDLAVYRALKDGTTVDNQKAWRLIRGVAWSEHPIHKVPRVIAVLLKCEEMALNGDIDAMKLYFDRALGKQADGLAVALGAFDSLKDGELMEQFKNVVQSPKIGNPPVKAENVQTNEGLV